MAKKKELNKPSVVNQDLPFEVAMVDPKTLNPHEKNWRKHSQRQRQAYQALKSSVGWAGVALLNKRTGKLLDGHMRREEAIRNNESAMPVIIGDWSEEQERLILTQLDPLGAMAQTNAEALNDLLKQTSNNVLDNIAPDNATSKILRATSTDLAEHAAGIELGTVPDVLLEKTTRKRSSLDEQREVESHKRENRSVLKQEIDEAIIFPLDETFLDLPSLLPGKLCTVVPDSIWNRTPESVSSTAWYCQSAGSSTFPSPDERQGGILGFFCDDWRFEVAWNESADFAQRILEQDWAGAALPDYSTYTDWPLAVCLNNIYRSRWCGRLWQELDIPVIPILQNCGRSEALTEECIGALPKKVPVAAIQCRTNDGTNAFWKGFVEFIALCKSTITIETLVIYGGEEHWKSFGAKLPKGINYVPIDSFVARRRGLNK